MKKRDTGDFLEGLTRIDAKGNAVIRSDVWGRFFKDSFNPLVLNFSMDILDFKTVYMFPKLKQTGYEIDLATDEIISISGGEIIQYEQAMKTEDVKIRFHRRNRTEHLGVYIDDRVARLHCLAVKASMTSGNPNQRLGNISSVHASKLLSVGGKVDFRDWKVTGNSWIFESNELLDQLVITTLLYCARKRWQIAHELLFVLLRDDVERFVSRYFEGVGRVQAIPQEKEEVLSIAQEFVFRVILDDITLAERFRFIPTAHQSLHHFLVGRGRVASGAWIPKLQEYFADSILPEYIQESKNRFDPKYSEEEKLRLNGVENEASARDFNWDVILAQIRQKLPERDAEILRMRFIDDLTLEKIGEHFGIKKSYVSKIVKCRKEELRRLVV